MASELMFFIYFFKYINENVNTFRIPFTQSANYCFFTDT